MESKERIEVVNTDKLESDTTSLGLANVDVKVDAAALGVCHFDWSCTSRLVDRWGTCKDVDVGSMIY